MNAAAADRARYYAAHFGSAAAALEVVNQPGHNDAFDRDVVTHLNTMRRDEALAALSMKKAA
ncbi:hypothetical protein [Brevundimonas sp. Root1279]|uniref:hypothetical protein n=1 Tax=Brevundimonas sp. Root1279 TaxID=1736443 RepID=UPI0006F4F779|nr:hypothetical protein [Brevundimonas sp. Root1279]KQW79747.1 hypothetical protein ASC65_14460 [Brevundimonas sp. Root1279]